MPHSSIGSTAPPCAKHHFLMPIIDKSEETTKFLAKGFIYIQLNIFLQVVADGCFV